MKKDKKEELDVEGLERTEDGKFILPLENPIVIGDKKVDSLILQEPKTKHLRRLSSTPNMDEIMEIVGDLAGETDSVINELSMTDGAKAAEFFSSFM